MPDTKLEQRRKGCWEASLSCWQVQIGLSRGRLSPLPKTTFACRTFQRPEELQEFVSDKQQCFTKLIYVIASSVGSCWQAANHGWSSASGKCDCLESAKSRVSQPVAARFRV